MTAYYPTYCTVFLSRIDPEAGPFRTPEAARQYDLDLALGEITAWRDSDYEAAFETRNDRMALVLKFLAEETDLMPEFSAGVAA